MPAEARVLTAPGAQFLRLGLSGVNFLLNSQASMAIEPEAQLVPERNHPYIVAWRVVLSERWPVFHLDASLQARGTGPWEKAVFIAARPFPVGIAASNLLLLPSDIHVEPLTLPGGPLTGAGPLFSGAWLQGSAVTLAFAPEALIAWLKTLENPA
ncbi:MAG TPA: hypothetical protein VFN52_01260 [Acidiferrobacteraceae bacterium]|nr:hypothetical protein [Acidiferrobacteraceae bacterium]